MVRPQLKKSVVGGVCRIKPINSRQIILTTHVVLSTTPGHCSSGHAELNIAQWATKTYFWDLLEGVWRRGCRVQCARVGLRVCEWSTEVHAAGTVDVFGKQASKNAHDVGLDKHCTL